MKPHDASRPPSASLAETPFVLEMAGDDESLAVPVAGPARTGPRRMDEHLAQKITELTRERYRKSLRGFIEWLDEFQLRPVEPEEFDDLAVEYNNASAGMTRPAFVLLLSALESYCCADLN